MATRQDAVAIRAMRPHRKSRQLTGQS